MKKTQISTVIRNRSKYSVDTVWENAKDLEHVAYLHGKTNSSFQLLYAGSESGSAHEYDILVYRAVRKLGPLRFNSFGMRRIVSRYNIHQLEYTPLLKTTTALNSLLFSSGNPEFPTLMVDEVIMEVPWYFAPLRSYFQRAMHDHANVQCQEDEPFRERRTELRERGVNLPFSIFNLSDWQKLTSCFSINLQTRIENAGERSPQISAVAAASAP